MTRAGFGALASTFVPILWGFDVFFGLAAVVFAATAGADLMFHRGLAESAS